MVIVHNDAGRLPRAVNSVRRGTHTAVEIVISDDHSTDDTPAVAAALAARDPRVRVLRLAENSGGCGAPRNRALATVRTPFVMFLDSDDELPPRAVEILLAAHAGSDVDFTMGAVERVRTDTGQVSRWMGHLFEQPRTVYGLAAEPRLLFEPLSTNKMYRTGFLDRHGLRFPEGLHYEDQLFSARAYTLARAFTLVTEVVYRWYIDPHARAGAATISNRRHLIGNVRDRVTVARMIDRFLADRAVPQEVREEKDYKFLAHDLRLYAGDLPYRETGWVAEFAAETVPYLDGLSDFAFGRLGRDERVVIGLLREGRYAEAQLAARGLGGGAGPRATVTDTRGRVYWGGTLPATAAGRRDLEVTEWDLPHCPFGAARFRHEAVRVARGPGSVVELTVRTWDPGLRLALAPHPARLHIAPGGRRTTVPLRLEPAGRGVFEGTARLDLAAVALPTLGFPGARHPVVELPGPRDDHRPGPAAGRRTGPVPPPGPGAGAGPVHTGPLLAPLDLAPFEMAGAGRHRVTVGPEGRGAGRLQLRWHPRGAAHRLLAPLLRLARRPGPARRLLRTLTGT
ncbi:glycosyltransferase [Streptomyces sp. LP05-1]|uniref:Glycosyltransferase n=1 Tax=Streptomyces pyxinae TaxID=2970734 RepID=A0ABT2CP26_9ACTN|nr:glycosyltransferase family 2 protein [Streptomyces sp. LP05-1]MCS0639179.1 glycosyltransferase [Streptomyces sp. LP05-1]